MNLAKALINSPKILLLDEPTASLDPEVASYIRKFLLSEREASRTSIILTSHNMAEVEEVCDRVIFIHNGKIVADDTPRALARSLRTTKMELYVPESASRLRAYCKKHNLVCRADNNRVTIEISENQIANVLQEIAAAGIAYEEISIEKPTLGDYFLKVAKVTSTTHHED